MPTSTPPVTLGIDVGTTNVKAALVAWTDTDAADVLATAAAPTATTVEGVLSAVADVVARCLAAPGRRSAPLAVAVSSMAETGVPLDARGAPLTPLVGWDDDRAQDVVGDLAAVCDPGALFETTGVRLGPKPPLAKWFWFARTDPSTWRRTAMWAGAADLVVHALTGRYATDHTLAGRTGAARLDASGFDPDLTAIGGLAPDRLPDLLAPGEVAGRVRAGALGGVVAAGTPVYVAGHDHAVGAHAVGVRSPGDVADSLGTSEAVYAVVDPVPPDARGAVAAQGMSVVRTVGGSRHAVVAGSPAAGGLIAWWCRNVAVGRTPDDVFRDLDRDADAGVIVLPYPRGRQAPRPDPGARLEIRGLGDGDGPATLAEALVRGLVLHARWMTEVAAGGPPRSVVLLGGPTRNDGWVRRKAELSPWPVSRAVDADTVAVGAALIAAERSGVPAAPLAAAPCGVTAAPARPVSDAALAPPAARPTAHELYAAFLVAAGRRPGATSTP